MENYFLAIFDKIPCTILLPSGSLLTGQSLLSITDSSIFTLLYKLFSFSHLSASTTIGFLTTNKFLVLVDVLDV